MRHHKEMRVLRHVFTALEDICERVRGDVRKNGIEFDKEVVFDDGNRMAIQVCGPGDPKSEPCWTQGVMFDADGNELGCTDPGESLAGEYSVTVGENEYVVNVCQALSGRS